MDLAVLERDVIKREVYFDRMALPVQLGAR